MCTDKDMAITNEDIDKIMTEPINIAVKCICNDIYSQYFKALKSKKKLQKKI